MTGRVKAKVLPDPVDAAITRFSPFNRRGITAFCTGVGVWKPTDMVILEVLENVCVR